MGTTMHAHIEVKKDNRWLHYGCPDIERNYLLFACINGTRLGDFDGMPELKSRIRPVCAMDELPDNMSEVTKICLENDRDCGLKGFGVIGEKAIMDLQAELNKLKDAAPEYLGEGCDLEENIFKTYISGSSIARHPGFDDVRIVFWFDN